LKVRGGKVVALAGLGDAGEAGWTLRGELYDPDHDAESVGCEAVHDRMSVILPPAAWLDPGMQDADRVALLAPFDSSLMRRCPVGTTDSLVANDGPGCAAPVELPQAATSIRLTVLVWRGRIEPSESGVRCNRDLSPTEEVGSI
jgi:putative SOS response-associated peptidase YedK